MDIETRLRHLDEGQIEILRRIDKIDGEIVDLNDMVRDTVIEIGGVPDQIGRNPNRRSIRVRLHDIETEKATVEAAKAALSAASQLHASAAEKRFSRREKLAGLVLAVVVAAGPYLAPLLFHHPS